MFLTKPIPHHFLSPNPPTPLPQLKPWNSSFNLPTPPQNIVKLPSFLPSIESRTGPYSPRLTTLLVTLILASSSSWSIQINYHSLDSSLSPSPLVLRPQPTSKLQSLSPSWKSFPLICYPSSYHPFSFLFSFFPCQLLERNLYSLISTSWPPTRILCLCELPSSHVALITVPYLAQITKENTRY